MSAALTANLRSGLARLRIAILCIAIVMAPMASPQPTQAGVFDDVLYVMDQIDKVAPGVLPFTGKDMRTYQGILNDCIGSSNADDVVLCADALSKTDGASALGGPPSWFPQMVTIYLDISNKDYWALVEDAGEAVACAAAQILTGGLDVCGAIKALLEAAEAVYDAAEDAAEFMADIGSALYDLGEDAYCYIAGCPNPPPPTGYSEGVKWCSGYGGVKSLMSKSNQPNDWSVECNDGSQCSVKPGQPPKCQTAAQKTAAQNQTIAKNNLDFLTEQPKWLAAFEAKYSNQCEDQICRDGIKALRVSTNLLLNQKHAADPLYPWAFTSLERSQAEANATKIVQASVQRSIDFNKKTTQNAAGGWEQLAIGVWTPKCIDQMCRDEIVVLAGKMRDMAITLQAQQPNSSSLNVQGQASKAYGPQFQNAIDKAKTRANPNASIPAKITAMGCSSFLGRKDEYLCEGGANSPGYSTCVAYAKQGQAKVCRNSMGQKYP